MEVAAGGGHNDPEQSQFTSNTEAVSEDSDNITLRVPVLSTFGDKSPS